MAFNLNDLISRSEKKRKEQPVAREIPLNTLEQKVELNTVIIEEQQRKAEKLAKPIANNKEEVASPRRTYQVKTRLSEEEKKYFDQRVQTAGLSQGDFMRQILLHESVEIRSVTAMDAEALGSLSEIASELGRIGGMIRGTVIRNKGEFGILTPQQKSELESQLRELNRLKLDIQKAVLAVCGDH